MTNDKTLLAVWKENLLTELKQSIFWDALPHNQLDRIDFLDLQPNDFQFPFRWMRQLLDNPTVQVMFSPAPSLAKQIKHLYYEGQIDFAENGYYPLGFGYPLLLQPDPEEPNKHIAAPLFIWQLHLKPNPEHPGDWIIERKPNAPIQANEFLLYYLKNRHQLNLSALTRDALANNQITQLDLLKVSNEIALHLGLEGNISTINATKIPKGQELDDILTAGGAISWSGTIGIYPPKSAKNLYILDAELDKAAMSVQAIGSADSDVIFPEPPSKTEDFRQYDYTALPVNPYQGEIIRAINQQERIVVSGGNGTGKTQTIAALLSNLLANRRKTLVISNKVNGLQAIQNRLDKIGLGELTYVISDPQREKSSVVEAIYQSSLGARKLPQFEEEDFQFLLNRTNRLRSRLDTAYDLFSKPIFDQSNWTETVGLFINNQKTEGKRLLNSHLQSKDFQLNKAEFEEITAKIERAEHLYSEVNTLKHPLRVLHLDIFRGRSYEDAKSFTYDTLDKILAEVNDIYQKFVVELENYSGALNKQFDNYYEDLKEKTAEVRADISDYKTQYGDDFNKFGVLRNLRMKAFSVFSKRLTNVLTVKNEVRANYNDIQGGCEHQRYFAYSFPKVRGGLTFDKLSVNLDDFEQSLEEWKAGTPNIVLQELERLNEENINEGVDFEKKVAELNQDFTDLINRVNGYQLFQKKFHSDANTLVKKRAFLEEMTETLENLQYNLRDFDAYYFWTNFWLDLRDNQQAVIKSLIVTKPKNWSAAFNSWYFHHLLNNNYDANILADGKTLQEYNAIFDKFSDYIPKKALKYWKLKQADEVRRIRKESKFLYNAFFGKSRQRFAEELNVRVLFDTEFEMLTNMFPVLLMPPAIASEWLPAIESYFDVVVVDNAENIQTEDSIAALWRGKRHLILGDELRIGKTMVASTLSYAKQSGYQRFELPFYHQAINEKIWKFKNAAFYNNDIRILPTQKTTANNPLDVAKIEGVYIDDQRINEEEAEHVLHLLNQIEPKENGQFPSIGIVCMTKEQRNLISYFIEQIKSRKIAGNERIMHLEQSGLHVHYYRDVQDYHFEVMMVSTTYAMNVKDQFTDDVLEMNELEGLQGLNTLIAAAAQKIHLVTSIPQTYIEHYAKYNPKAQGVHILANLISYAGAVQKNDEVIQDEILERLLELHKNATPKPPAQEQVFVKELAEAISPYLEEGRLSVQQNIDGIATDLLVEPIHPGQPKVAIQSDGSFWRFPKGDYLWEKAIETQLNTVGIDYVSAWSLDFWKSPEWSVKQLAATLIKHDEHYRPKPPVIVSNTDVEISTDIPASEPDPTVDNTAEIENADQDKKADTDSDKNMDMDRNISATDDGISDEGITFM